jgi:hypothetical protein
VDTKCPTVGTWVFIPGFCVPIFNKTCIHTHWLARASKWSHEFTSCWPRSYFTFDLGYSQGMLSIPYSVKLLPPLERMAGFRNTRKYELAWYTLESHSFLQRFSERQHSTPFIHGTEDIKSEQHKAIPHVTLGMNLISANQWWQIEQQISHTHTHTHTHKLVIF